MESTDDATGTKTGLIWLCPSIPNPPPPAHRELLSKEETFAETPHMQQLSLSPKLLRPGSFAAARLAPAWPRT